MEGLGQVPNSLRDPGFLVVAILSYTAFSQKYAAFYDLGDRELHYWISALLIRRMIGPDDAAVKKIPRYLDLIGRGNTDAALSV